MSTRIKIKESDIHPHIKARTLQRGISLDEIETTLNKGRYADDAQEGTAGKVFIFPYNAEWEGINNKIKRLKRMAYGYRDVKYFLLKIHQHCGLLNPKLST